MFYVLFRICCVSLRQTIIALFVKDVDGCNCNSTVGVLFAALVYIAVLVFVAPMWTWCLFWRGFLSVWPNIQELKI